MKTKRAEGRAWFTVTATTTIAVAIGVTLLLSAACTGQDGAQRRQTTTQASSTGGQQQPAVPLPTAEELKSRLAAYPRTDGSSSAQPLATLIAARRLEVGHRMGSWLDGSERGWLIVPAPDGAGDEKVQERLREIREHSGTHGSYVNLIEGKRDVIFVARAPSEDELKLAKERNVELDARPIAYDAFVFIVHKDNPLKGVSEKQIRGIYTGEITDWKEVGEPEGTITPYVRNRNSGSQELMEQLVMRGTEMIEGRDMISAHTMMGAINNVVRDEKGIGYTVYFWQTRMLRPANQPKMIAVDGVYPEMDTIRTEEYPYTTKVYVVTRKSILKGGPAATLRDWVLSPGGQAVVKQSGYVPYGSVGKPPPAPE